LVFDQFQRYACISGSSPAKSSQSEPKAGGVPNQ
jgi:hypothetical protein